VRGGEFRGVQRHIDTLSDQWVSFARGIAHPKNILASADPNSGSYRTHGQPRDVLIRVK
jgi:hypothetical protein